jgi:phage baseplate assembly protein gpV
MINALNPTDEGPKEFRAYLATVVDNNDPLRFQRVKVTIPGLLEDSLENLPWLLPMHASLFGSGNTMGIFSVPPVGAQVVVHFQGNDILYGLILGSLPIKGSDLSPLTENYPYRYGFKDPSGNYFYVDTTAGSTTVEFRHKSGTTINIADDGKVSVATPSSLNISVQQEATVNIQGNASVEVTGTLTTKASNWNHTGPLLLQGNATVAGNVTVIGNIGAGNITGAAVTGGGINLATHKHGGVDSGSSQTSPPVN